jgi:hypothetical protein
VSNSLQPSDTLQFSLELHWVSWEKGSAKKARQRVAMVSSVASKAAWTLASSPLTSEGSSNPQCAFTAGPKYTGQASPAALSHGDDHIWRAAFKGVVALAVKPSVLIPAACNVLRLRGRTWPLGKLPELTAWNPAVPGG